MSKMITGRIVPLVMFLLIVSIQVGYSQNDVIVNVAEKAKGNDALVDTTIKNGKWEFRGNFQLEFSQFYANNWQGAGDPFIGLRTLDFMSLSYRKNKFAWISTLSFDFGMQWNFHSDSTYRNKTTDKIELNTQVGYRASGNWYYVLSFNGLTQITDGYRDEIKVSTFMTPAIFQLALGMEHKQKTWSWFIAPISAKMTTKLSKEFFNQSIPEGVDSGKLINTTVGAFTRLMYNNDIHKRINLNTRLEFFYDYLGEYEKLRNLATNFEMIWNFSITDWLMVSFKTALRYDYATRFPVMRRNASGELVEVGKTDHLQFQESIGLVLGYKIRVPKK